MKKYIAILLSMVMVMTSLPMTVFALESNDYKSEILYEKEERRSENSKTFVTEKGTYVTAISSDSLCYYKDGDYHDIDNTIIKKDRNTLSNVDNAYSVELPRVIDKNDGIKITKDDYSITLSLKNDISKSKSKVTNFENDIKETTLEDEIQNKLQQDKTTSEVKYENVLDNIDLEYQIMPSIIKENIILNEAPENDFKIDYCLETNGLDLTVNDDNSISLLDGEDEIFLLNPAVMFDSNDNSSYDISLSVNDMGNGEYTLSYSPNSEWLLDSSRVYPVIIDPDISVWNTVDNYDISSGYISNLSKKWNYHSEDNLYVRGEFGASSTVRESYFNINSLSFIDTDSMITNAEFNVYKKTESNNSVANTFNMYMVNTNYTAENITYSKRSDMSSADFIILDKECRNNEGYLGFNITKAINTWLDNNTSNKLLALTGNDSTDGVQFASTRSSNNKPYITVEYVKNNEITNENELHCLELGYAGKVYLNDASGEVMLNTHEFDYSGEGTNLELSFFMCNKMNEALTNFDETLKPILDSDNYIQTLSDNSTKLYIHDYGNAYHEEVTNKEYLIYYEGDLLILEEVVEENAYAEIKKFEDSYLVNSSYETPFGGTEYIEISRDDDACINSIVDHTNARFDFEYENEKISEIHYTNNREDRNSEYSLCDGMYDSFNTIIDLEYSENYISSITTSINSIQNSTAVSYSWDNGKLVSVIDENGVTTKFTYDLRDRISKIERMSKSYSTSNGNSTNDSMLLYSYEYGDRQTIITDKNGNEIIEKFDDDGKLESILNSDGTMEFLGGLDESFSRKISKSTNYSMNYIINGDFESSNDCCFNLENINHSFNSSEEVHSGNRCLKINGINRTVSLDSVVSVDRNDAYTLSCWVKGVSDTTARLVAYDSDDYSTAISVNSDTIKCNDDWQQASCTINTVNKKVYFVLEVLGEVQIDDVRLENKLSASSKNFVKDSEFSNNSGIWALNGNAIDTVDFHNPKCDDSVLKIQNSMYENEKYSYQRINGDFNSGDKYTISANVLSTNTLPAKENRFIEMRVYKPNTQNELSLTDDNLIGTVQFDVVKNDWQYMASEITLDSDYNCLYVVLVSSGLEGYTYFDGLEMYRDAFYVAKHEIVTENNSEDQSIINHELISDYSNDEVITNIIKPTNYTVESRIIQSEDNDEIYRYYFKDLVGNSNDDEQQHKFRFIYTFDEMNDLLSANIDKFGRTFLMKYNAFKKPSMLINCTDYNNEYCRRFISDEYGKLLLVSPIYDYSMSMDFLIGSYVFEYDGSLLSNISIIVEPDCDLLNDEEIDYSMIPMHPIVNFEYNQWGDLVEVSYGQQSGDNYTYRYEYDSKRNLSKIIYPNKQQESNNQNNDQIVFSYDDNNNLVLVSDNLDKNDERHIETKYMYFKNNQRYATCDLTNGRIITSQNGVTKEYYVDDFTNINHSYGVNREGQVEEITNNIHSVFDTKRISNTIDYNYTFYSDSGSTTKANIVNIYDDYGRVVRRNYCYSDNDTPKVYIEYEYLNSESELGVEENKNAIKPHNLMPEFGVEDNSIIESDLVREATCYTLQQDDNGEFEYKRLYSYRYLYDQNNNVTCFSIVTDSDESSSGDEESAGEEDSSDNTPNDYLVSSYIYGYDDNNRLSIEADFKNNIQYKYYYDNYGNVVRKTSSRFISFTPVTETDVDILTYDNSDNNIGKLLSYNNYIVNTDEKGNIVQLVDQSNVVENLSFSISYKYSSNNKFIGQVVANVPETSLISNETIVNNISGTPCVRTSSSGYTYKYFWKEDKLSSMVISSINDYEDVCVSSILYDVDDVPYGFAFTRNDSSTVIYYYILDPSNRIIGIMDENGNVQSTYSYSAWGSLTVDSSRNIVCAEENRTVDITKVNPLFYKGYVYDFNSEMYFINGRYYSPKLYRYTTKDDSVTNDPYSIIGFNQYIFNNNSPINSNDFYDTENIILADAGEYYKRNMFNLTSIFDR